MAKKSTGHLLICSFCSRNQREVKKLIAGPGIYICNECVQLCNEIIATEVTKKNVKEDFELPTPHTIKAFLDEYVIGQEEAKKVLSVAVYNHYKRITHNLDHPVELQKSNVLLIGSTGTGKTLLAQTLARFLKVPFTVADATSLTQAGYVGEDVDSMVQNLFVAADYDVAQTEKGIIYIDEIDKVARKIEGASHGRDVSGEGVQQGLLKMMEGTKLSMTARGGKKYEQPEGALTIDTSHILFICGGAFSGLETIIERRIGKKKIGFEAQKGLDRPPHDVGAIFHQVRTEDLLSFGLIPEFIGRLPVIATLEDACVDNLASILQQPKNALVKQYQKLFHLDGVELHFTEDALKAVAEEAMKRKSGARGLRSVLEHAMLEIMYRVPYLEGIQSCTITRDVIVQGAEPILAFAAEKKSA